MYAGIHHSQVVKLYPVLAVLGNPERHKRLNRIECLKKLHSICVEWGSLMITVEDKVAWRLA